MLAQLLIQFQMPLEKTAVQNVTASPLVNETFNNYLNNSTIELERKKRSIPSIAENEIPRDPENLIVKENFIAPDSTTNGMAITILDTGFKQKKTH